MKAAHRRDQPGTPTRFAGKFDRSLDTFGSRIAQKHPVEGGW